MSDHLRSNQLWGSDPIALMLRQLGASFRGLHDNLVSYWKTAL